MIEHADAATWLAMQKPCSLDAIVTSPPYADVRGDYPCVGVEEYGSFTLRWTTAALDAVKPTGSLLLNLGYLWRDGVLSTYHGEALGAAIYAGWSLVHELMWFKPNANPIQGRFVTQAHEPVYWLARDPARVYDGSDEIRRPYAEGTAARYERGWTNHTAVKGSSDAARGRTLNPLGARAQSVLVHTTGREKGNPHPCPMPLGLADELVRLVTPPGGIVADPFAGSGTTLLAAVRAGREAIGCDIDPASVALADERIRSSRQLA